MSGEAGKHRKFNMKHTTFVRCIQEIIKNNEHHAIKAQQTCKKYDFLKMKMSSRVIHLLCHANFMFFSSYGTGRHTCVTMLQLILFCLQLPILCIYTILVFIDINTIKLLRSCVLQVVAIQTKREKYTYNTN